MIRFVSAFVPAVLVTGCAGITGPGNRAGPYAMTAVDGSDLPHVVSSTSLCDQLVSAGLLDLRRDGSFLLRVAQVQDCSRGGAPPDSFTTTTTGAFTITGTQLSLRPAGTGLHYDGTVSAGSVEVHLPPLPLVSPPDHVAKFIKFPL